MQKRLMLIVLVGLLMLAAIVSLPSPVAQGQDAATATPAVQGTGAGPTSNVTIFIVVCDNRVVVNFSGTMQAGYDIYYQAFSGANGTGNAITGLRQLVVNGSYQVSEVANYNSGTTVAAGAGASVTVRIAREGNPDNTLFTQSVNDLQDGCGEPQFTAGTSTDAGPGGSTDNTTTLTNADGSPIIPILSPFGGNLNPDYTPRPEDLVKIGPRDRTPPRQKTPGLIFAECNQYPISYPGLVYDTDRIVVFWSWFARTPELVQQHIDNVNYSVDYYGNPFNRDVIVTPIEQRTRNYWVFYYIDLGNIPPGAHQISYRVTWNQPISDGFDDYGPGTANEELTGSCNFLVTANPEGKKVAYTFP